jgi:hypothetical protein
VFAEPKVRSSPEASKKDKGVVARRGLEEVQSKDAGRRTGTGSEVWYIRDEWARVQEPDLRCGTSGTSGHVTAKSSIRNWDVLYKSGVYALKATCLTLGGLYSVCE